MVTLTVGFAGRDSIKEPGSDYDIPEGMSPLSLTSNPEQLRLTTNSMIVSTNANTSAESLLLNISADSLNVPRSHDTSFDRDSIGDPDAPVIQTEGEKTIIGITNIPVSNSRVTISSSSWINVEAEPPLPTEEPIKPPRLKKIARQQSKQELLRDKGFGIPPAQRKEEPVDKELKSSSGRPDISSPIFINSTLNPDDLETHKCIPVSRSQSHSSRSTSSFADGSFYTLESVLDETYGARHGASDEYNDHIYEEIQENKLLIRPLPPIPEGEQRTLQAGSIFTGATRSEILHYLNDARQRLGGHASDTEPFVDETYSGDGIFLGIRNTRHRISAVSNYSESSTSSNDSSDSSSTTNVLWRGAVDSVIGRPTIERNDSGVGSDFGTSSSAGSKIVTDIGKSSCDDCEIPTTDNEPLCHKCNKRRAERKEIINEIVETEIKYGKDLGIIMNEFYKPILGKLTLHFVFLNFSDYCNNKGRCTES